MDTIESANVVINKVEVRMMDSMDEYPFLTLMEDTVEFNLLDLRNGVTAELLNVEVPAGTYDLIRLYVVEASLKIKGGETYTVKVPSGAQTGIKVFLEPGIRVAGGLSEDILLDFSLEKSFVMKGNMYTPAGIKGFNFKPVIRAANLSTSGSLMGMVSDTSDAAVKNASVWIEKDTVVATTMTDTLGYYGIIGIPEGFYSVYATAENHDTVSFDDVEIVAGNKTLLDFVLTPKQ